MSAINAEASRSTLGDSFDSHHGQIDLSPGNTTAPGFGKGLMALFLGLGILCLAATAAFPFIVGTEGPEGAKHIKHALFSYHVGVMGTMGIMLGALGLVLIFRAVQAGWCTTIRRQCENIASLLPLGLLFFVPYAIFSQKMWKWMLPENQNDPLLEAKRFFLYEPFLVGRIILYLLFWAFLATRLFALSKAQDVSGDKTLTNKAQITSTWGLLLYALTTSFAAFDMIMALDYHWFSTMFGVYFFAGNVLSGVSMTILVLGVLRASGKLKGLVTSEHGHDLGKLLKAFTIFWAYIAFSQYFLIWYANIPEETAWILLRKNNGWDVVFWLLAYGHFIAPFLILLIRDVKRNWTLLCIVAAWQLIMHFADHFWQIRPVIYQTVPSAAGNLIPGKVGFSWVDITGILGPFCLFLGLLVWRVGTSPLIPTKDPRLVESLNHKNYV